MWAWERARCAGGEIGERGVTVRRYGEKGERCDRGEESEVTGGERTVGER